MHRSVCACAHGSGKQKTGREIGPVDSDCNWKNRFVAMPRLAPDSLARLLMNSRRNAGPPSIVVRISRRASVSPFRSEIRTPLRDPSLCLAPGENVLRNRSRIVCRAFSGRLEKIGKRVSTNVESLSVWKVLM